MSALSDNPVRVGLVEPLSEPEQRVRSFPLYYGWVNVFVASVMMTATLPGRTHGLGLMTKPLLADLQISGVTYGWMNFFAVVIGSLFCVPIGKLVDRYGSRGVLTGVTLLFGLVTLWSSWMRDPISFFAALTLARGLTQAGLTVGATALVGKWFKRRIGYSMAAYSVLMAIGFMASTWAAGAAVKEYGWRPTWMWIGVTIIFTITPLVGVFVRSSPPEDEPEIQELPGHQKVSNDTDSKAAAAFDFTMLQAIGSPTFWIFTLAYAMFAQSWSAITLFNELILKERGFEHDTFILMMVVLPVSGMAAKFFVGWMANHCRLGNVMAIGMLLLATSMCSFPFLTAKWQVVLYALGLGLSGSFIMVAHMAFYPKAYGRTHLGQVQGAAQVVAVIISASGPVILEYCKQHSGSYALMFFSTATVMLGLALLAWLVPLPRRPTLATQ